MTLREMAFERGGASAVGARAGQRRCDHSHTVVGLLKEGAAIVATLTLTEKPGSPGFVRVSSRPALLAHGPGT